MNGQTLYPIFRGQPPQKRSKIELGQLYSRTDDSTIAHVEQNKCRPVPAQDSARGGAQNVAIPPPSCQEGKDRLVSHDAKLSNVSNSKVPNSQKVRIGEPAASKRVVATGALATLMDAGRVRVTRQRFHLDLKEDGTYTTRWQKEGTGKRSAGQSESGIWKAEMKLKDGSGNSEILLTVSTEQPSATKEHSVTWECTQLLSNRDHDRRPKLSASLLKSATQKDVRLGRPSPAMRASLHLIKESWSEFLRRATIIALEDAILHPDLPFLVWLTAAVAKGYQPSKRHAAVCLRIMHELAAVRCRDPLSDADEADTQCPSISDISEHVSTEKAIILKALLLRASFGGMAGDVRMLRCYARVWHKRLSGASPPPPPIANFRPGAADVTLPSSDVSMDWADWLRQLYAQTPPPPQVLATCPNAALPAVVDMAAIPGIKLSDVPPSAVDFHCSNIIEDILKDTLVGRQVAATCRKEGTDAEAVFRSAMWHFRSSKNVKNTLYEEAGTENDDGSQASKVWSQLSSEAQKYSLTVVKRRFGIMS